MLGDFLQSVEQSIADLALSLGLAREQTAMVRKWWRAQRLAASAANRKAAEAEPVRGRPRRLGMDADRYTNPATVANSTMIFIE